MPRKTPDINKILATPAHKACSRYGAAMGRPDVRPSTPCKLYLQRVKPCDGGDYDAGGAYWGSMGRGYYQSPGSKLWCAFGEDDEKQVMLFVRAADRVDAKQQIETMPGMAGLVSWHR